MLQLVGGGAQSSRSLPVGSSSFGGRGSSVEHTALWKERLMYVIYNYITVTNHLHYMYIVYTSIPINGIDLAQQHSY